MTTVAYIGSCLSYFVVQDMLKLRPDARLVEGMQHIRLDLLCDYLVDNVPFGAPQDVTAAIVENLFPHEKPLYWYRLKHQTSESLTRVKHWLRKTNCLIVDNNYDLSSSLFEFKYGGGTFRFLNAEIKNGICACKNLGLMPMEGAGIKYQRLFDCIRELNPTIQIVFLHYPVTGFEQQGWYERVTRARHFAQTVELRDNVHVFPLIKLNHDFVDPEAKWHFPDKVYRAYANAIFAIVDGKRLSLPRTGEVPLSALERASDGAESQRPNRLDNPYAGLPARNYWKPAVADLYPLSISELYVKKFPVSLTDAVATCGSCFAQHIGRRLQANGFNFLDIEPAPASFSANDRIAHGYGIYSARYGNVYTSTQLLQVFQRALGEITIEEVWETKGRYYDPFRPNLDPEGFDSPEAMAAERSRHLSAVRRLMEQLDVFIFTMGLTECWYNAETSAVYPICPGVTVGRFDPTVHKFRNLSFAQVMADMTAVVDRLRSIKPDVRILLTVSPVPLTATAENRHVLLSTMHSKSVLRAVAGELATQHDFIDYFPSYDIVMSSPFRGMFFQNNLRTIHEEGVDYIMSHFFRQHRADQLLTLDSGKEDDTELFCDEMFLELERQRTQGAARL